LEEAKDVKVAVKDVVKVEVRGEERVDVRVVVSKGEEAESTAITIAGEEREEENGTEETERVEAKEIGMVVTANEEKAVMAEITREEEGMVVERAGIVTTPMEAGRINARVMAKLLGNIAGTIIAMTLVFATASADQVHVV
jgi:hypothetical protein